jgi:hypothetical protein
MEITVTLSESNINLIAIKVAELLATKKFQPPKDPKPEQEIIYTVNEIAEMTKRKPQTIRFHIQTSLLIAEKVGKSWLISESSYNKYIKNEL